MSVRPALRQPGTAPFRRIRSVWGPAVRPRPSRSLWRRSKEYTAHGNGTPFVSLALNSGAFRGRRRQKISGMSAPLSLTDRQRRHLRGIAHALKPVVRLGNAGLTEPVLQETARALEDHELIKVKSPGGDRAARDALFAELSHRTGSALVHRIGNVAVLYRPRADLPKIVIPGDIESTRSAPPRSRTSALRRGRPRPPHPPRTCRPAPARSAK